MDNAQLASLDQKIDQFVSFCDSLRTENQTLRDRVAGLEQDHKHLVEKIETARIRLEALLARLPEE